MTNRNTIRVTLYAEGTQVGDHALAVGDGRDLESAMSLAEDALDAVYRNQTNDAPSVFPHVEPLS